MSSLKQHTRRVVSEGKITFICEIAVPSGLVRFSFQLSFYRQYNTKNLPRDGGRETVVAVAMIIDWKWNKKFRPEQFLNVHFSPT